MAKVREGLAKQKREREQSQGWFGVLVEILPLVNQCHMQLVRIPAIVVLLLLLTFRPCILNKLIAFIKETIGAVQLMVLRQQYETLRTGPEEYELVTQDP